MFLIPYRDDNPSRSFPFLTLLLIATNGYFFYRSFTTDQFQLVVNQFGFVPKTVFLHPQTLITSLFLHGGLLHLISNMWFLYLFGDNIEDAFGRFPFVALYLTAGIVGNLVNAVFTLPHADIPVIGASGAVAGVMGSYLVRYPAARIRCLFLLIFYPFFFRLRAFWFIGFWLVFEFYAAYYTNSDNVAHWAHVGGFLLGMLWALGRPGRRYRARTS